MKFVKQKIQYLKKKLRYLEYLYYIKNESVVSNEIYDQLLKELHELELIYPHLSTKNSPTRLIGEMLQNEFRTIYHKIPMLSLNNILEESQLLLFDKRIKMRLNNNNILYCCELKVDGVAVSLLYKEGQLVSGATRGNGKIGEDITKNMRVINSVPLFLKSSNEQYNDIPYLLEIRGEVFIPKLCFLELNKITEQKGYKLFSNSRNAASGSLRQLDPNITATRLLSFCCHEVSYYFKSKKNNKCAEQLPNSHWQRLQLCKSWGIPISNYIRLIKEIDKVREYYISVQQMRSNLAFDIDGIVIKVDDCSDQSKLGTSLKAPNWAIAYKFPAKIKSTKVNRIVFRVGRTGIITPVAYLEPIEIDNVRIKKVNIHNINELKRLRIMIGDTVRIQRSGDVIPKILEVVHLKRTNDIQEIEIPLFCPECGTVINTWRQQSILRCMAGLKCPAQFKAALKHFVSKKAMNIFGLGDKVIDQLVNQKLVCTAADLFRLNEEKLLCLKGYRIKSATRLLKSLENSKQTTLARFVYALGIYNVGEAVSVNLAVTYKNLDNLMSADFQSLLKLKNVNSVVAMNIYSFFRDMSNIRSIQDLMSADIGIRLYSII